MPKHGMKYHKGGSNAKMPKSVIKKGGATCIGKVKGVDVCALTLRQQKTLKKRQTKFYRCFLRFCY